MARERVETRHVNVRPVDATVRKAGSGLLQGPFADPFAEAARTRRPEGSGLGLHIARDVARHHGFDLAFRRSEYGGLEVEFAGPLHKGNGA